MGELIRKPVQPEGLDLAREVSYALATAIQSLKDTVKEIVGPLAKQLEQVKSDLTALESEHGIPRREILALTVEAYWEIRPCFICSEHASFTKWDGRQQVRTTLLKYGPCSHREIEVALAELERIRTRSTAVASQAEPQAAHRTA